MHTLTRKQRGMLLRILSAAGMLLAAWLVVKGLDLVTPHSSMSGDGSRGRFCS